MNNFRMLLDDYTRGILGLSQSHIENLFCACTTTLVARADLGLFPAFA